MAGLTATLVNFPVVFAGLVAITIGANGDDKVALLNLWALWGIAQGLLGQVTQVGAVLDGRSWTDWRGLRIVPPVAVGTAVATILVSDRLFPGHPNWWIACFLLVIAVAVIGRQRGELARRLDGTTAVVIAALENSIRSAVVIMLLIAASDSNGLLDWGSVAIVAPFVVSMALLANRIESGSPVEADGPPVERPTSIVGGVLTGLPALAAYAVVPGLSLLDRTDDLGAIAIAASLLRGPLLVATFLAPVLLERWVVGPTRSLPAFWSVVPLAIVVAQAAVGLVTDEGSRSELVVQTVLAGLAAAAVYLLVLRSLPHLAASHTGAMAIGAAIGVFVVVLAVASRADWLHPFVALGAVAATLGVVLARIAPGTFESTT